MISRRSLITPLVAAGLLAGCADFNPKNPLLQMTIMPLNDFAVTGINGIQEKGLVGVLELPNAAMNGGLRVPEALVNVVTGDEPRPLGEYHPLAEPRAVTGAGWCALGGYIINGVTPGFGAAVCGGVGLIYDLYDSDNPKSQ